MPAPFSHGPTGASAESTEEDQLDGEWNATDADSLVIATDHVGTQQLIHTADYRLHIYTPMGQCLHLHSNVTFSFPLACMRHRANKGWCVASFVVLLLLVFLAKCCWLYVFFLNIQGPATTYCTVMWLVENWLSPSTHLVAGHLVSHLKKEKQNITVSHFHNTFIIMISKNLLSVCTHWPLFH